MELNKLLSAMYKNSFRLKLKRITSFVCVSALTFTIAASASAADNTAASAKAKPVTSSATSAKAKPVTSSATSAKAKPVTSSATSAKAKPVTSAAAKSPRPQVDTSSTMVTTKSTPDIRFSKTPFSPKGATDQSSKLIPNANKNGQGHDKTAVSSGSDYRRILKASLKPPAVVKRMWNLQNADVRAVINTVAKVTGRNFIVDPKLSGKVTIVSAEPMDNDEFYKAFLSMLQVLDYTAVPSGKFIKIVSSMDAKQIGAPLVTAYSNNKITGDEVVVRMVPIIHTSATQLISVIRPLMQNSSSINAYAPSNSLILAGAAGNINKLVRMIHQLDQQHSSRVVFVPLKHGDATSIVAVLKKLQSDGRSQGKVSNISYAADDGSNTILVSGTPENILQARNLISHLDSTKGEASAVVIHLNYLDPKKFAPTLTKLISGVAGSKTKGANSTPASVVAEEGQNAIVVQAPASSVQEIKSLVKQLDHRPGQVLVQAIIARVDSKFMNKYGVQWGMGTATPNAVGGVTYGIAAAHGTFGLGYDIADHKLLLPQGMGAILTALKNDTNSSVLATPSVMVLNNQKADISEGKTIRVVDQVGQPTGSAADGNYFGGSNYVDKKVVLDLQVTPQISPNNTLQLLINQKDDSIDGATGGSTAGGPVIDTQTLKTNVMVRSGSILVLGGVQQNTEHHDDEKIPILGDIPILGHLFKYNTKDHEKQSLMIFIRTKIVHNDFENTKASMRDYNFIRQRQIDYSANRIKLNDSPLVPYMSIANKTRLPSPF